MILQIEALNVVYQGQICNHYQASAESWDESLSSFCSFINSGRLLSARLSNIDCTSIGDYSKFYMTIIHNF